MAILREKRASMHDRMIEDPLRHIYVKRLIVYLVLLFICLLWPFDLFQENKVRWLKNSVGVEFAGNGLITTDAPATDLIEKMKRGKGLSIEAWLATSYKSQAGPARIISCSLDWQYRNFTIGQEGKKLAVRLRTTKTNKNGTKPSLKVNNVFITTNPFHLVVTYDGEKESVFIDGKQRLQKYLPGGDFSNWDPNHYFFLGNEGNGDRPWKGELFRVSLYNRPLEAVEIIDKYHGGITGHSQQPGQCKDSLSRGLVADYRFNEGSGSIIKDSGCIGKAVDLFIPEYAHAFELPFMRWQNGNLAFSLKHTDTVFNILGFIPFGFLLHGTLRNKFGVSWHLSVLVLLTGSFSSLTIEILQHYSISRDSSLLDLVNNTLGTAIGILIDCSYIRHVKHYWMRKKNW